MLRTAFIFVFSLLCFGLLAQQSTDELANLNGRLLSSKDSSAVVASLLYEKLPYYDDMGLISSKSDGSFSLPLIKGSTYIFSVSKEGYKKFSKEITINASNSQNELFYLEADEIELITLDNLIFARSSPKIAESSYSELNDLAVWMNENPAVVLQLEGHTDFRGNATANMELSQARVDAVRDYLISQKVKKNRILTKAFGGTQPISREDTEEAKALNRRVEVRVIRR